MIAMYNKISKYESEFVRKGEYKSSRVSLIWPVGILFSFLFFYRSILTDSFYMLFPCVAFDSAEGAREIISSNWDGYLIKDRDKEEMAKRVCILIDNYNRRFIMGNNALKKADKYSLEEVREKWKKIIK